MKRFKPSISNVTSNVSVSEMCFFIKMQYLFPEIDFQGHFYLYKGNVYITLLIISVLSTLWCGLVILDFFFLKNFWYGITP